MTFQSIVDASNITYCQYAQVSLLSMAFAGMCTMHNVLISGVASAPRVDEKGVVNLPMHTLHQDVSMFHLLQQIGMIQFQGKSKEPLQQCNMDLMIKSFIIVPGYDLGTLEARQQAQQVLAWAAIAPGDNDLLVPGSLVTLVYKNLKHLDISTLDKSFQQDAQRAQATLLAMWGS